MGSGISTPIIGEETYGGKSAPVIKLYSKQFETRDEVEDDMYLHGYGDEPDLEFDAITPVLDVAESLSSVDDDDYPIDSFSPNMGVLLPTSNTDEDDDSPPELENSENSSFSVGRSLMMNKLLDKYPKLEVKNSDCDAARDRIYECYNNSEDVANCRELVEDYSRCSRSELDSVLS